MKKQLLKLFILNTILTINIFAGFYFDVNMGEDNNKSAHIGLAMKSDVVRAAFLFGLDYHGVDTKLDVKVEGFEKTFKVEKGLLSPDFGFKLGYIKKRMYPYIFTSLYFCKGSFFAKPADYDIVLLQEIQNVLGKLLSHSGIKYGFGTEWFLDDNFSIGGQFYFNKIFTKINLDKKIMNYNIKVNFDNVVTKTESAVSLNYYY